MTKRPIPRQKPHQRPGDSYLGSVGTTIAAIGFVVVLVAIGGIGGALMMLSALIPAVALAVIVHHLRGDLHA